VLYFYRILKCSRLAWNNARTGRDADCVRVVDSGDSVLTQRGAGSADKRRSFDQVKEMRLGRVLTVPHRQAAPGRNLISMIALFCVLLLQLYHQESIYLVLVGLEVWTDGDLIAVNYSDHVQTLRDFCTYRQENINVYHNNDNAHLLTYVILY